MARIFRRAANKVKNSRDGHGSLGLLIFDEKVVYETFQKVVMVKADGELLGASLNFGCFIHKKSDFELVDRLQNARSTFNGTNFLLRLRFRSDQTEFMQ